jgi:hypothetical protein
MDILKSLVQCSVVSEINQLLDWRKLSTLYGLSINVLSRQLRRYMQTPPRRPVAAP